MTERRELLRVHSETARAAGVETEVLTEGSWLGRLEALVRELGVHSVALPFLGWPEGLRQTLEGALVKLGCAVVSPVHQAQGYAWDRRALAAAELGITWCTAFLAATGSTAFSSGPGLGTAASLLPFVHLSVGRASSLYADLGSYLAELGAKLPSRLTIVTGPSRTGDIEGTMNTGVHGPGRVIQWILADDV